MAPRPMPVTRQDSIESSGLSNIDVAGAGAATDDSASEQHAASTPPTSVSDNRSLNSSKAPEDASYAPDEINNRRSRRARPSAGSYNLKNLANPRLPAVASPSRHASGLSGRTLVNKHTQGSDGSAFGNEIDNALQPDWEIPNESPKRKLPQRPSRKPTVTERLKSGVKSATGSVRSILGKRSRDMFEAGKRKVRVPKAKEVSPAKNKLLKELDTGKGGVLDELDLDAVDEIAAPARPTKRAKTVGKIVLQEIAQPVTTGPLQKTSDGKKVKKWHSEGLYVGQDPDSDSTRVGPRKLQKKRPTSTIADENEHTEPKNKKLKLNFGLPMFSYLDKERNFIIPYDVFGPAANRGRERPKDWKQLNRNRLVGEARDLWDRSEKLAQSSCVCQPPSSGEMGCDYDCLNRVMQYECNQENCNLDPSTCSNRPFAELAKRTKKGGSFDIGVEVVKTEQRGFGIRAARSFKPGQIIMEYTGEIISEAECQRRMREDYKDKACYYLMELERNLVIDGTKGSMARFINHSCDPNCEVRMIKASGTPRMAVFAGDSGIMTGEELTYDYNFDNFGETRQPCYCGAGNCRGYLGKRLNATELKKQQREDAERKRKAAEIAQKAAEEEQRKKIVKNERGAGWHGWVPVAEVKAELIARKKELEEQERNSSRAKRLAARRASVPTGPATSSRVLATSRKDGSATRRKSVHLARQAQRVDAAQNPSKRLRRTSMGSRFTEELSPEKRSSSRSNSRQNGRGVGKSPMYSAKPSIEIPREETEGEDIKVASAPSRRSADHSGALNKISSRSSEDVEAGDNDEDRMCSEELEKLTERTTTMKNKRASLLATVSSAAKTAGTKWKQTTIGFAKLG